MTLAIGPIATFPTGTFVRSGPLNPNITPASVTLMLGMPYLVDDTTGQILTDASGNFILVGAPPTTPIVALSSFIVITAAAPAITLTGGTPLLAISLQPSDVNDLALTAGMLPLISVGGAFTPPAAALASDTGTNPPLLSAGTVRVPAAASLALTGPPASLFYATFAIPPDANDLALTPGSFEFASSVPPTSLALTTTAPSSLVGFNLTPAARGLALSAGATASVIGSLQPVVAALAITPVAPALLYATRETPPPSSLAAIAATPALSAGTVVNPPAAAVALASTAPTSVGSLQPASTTTALVGNLPTLSFGALPMPNAAGLALTMATPMLSASLQPSATSITLSPVAPLPSLTMRLVPGAAVLALSQIATPIQNIGTICTPSSVGLTLVPDSPDALPELVLPLTLTLTSSRPGVRLSIMPPAAALNLAAPTFFYRAIVVLSTSTTAPVVTDQPANTVNATISISKAA